MKPKIFGIEKKTAIIQEAENISTNLMSDMN